ncbi:MAG: RNHCP domain-containing protein [Fimbriimonadaceae bacterium]|nr:RNHCP domain-containing protein [Fimbriimonadaceae bacterium]QYK55760.1 MAG: RNHCP domain-containing protein [Fimbriimonadaceae bacterium]
MKKSHKNSQPYAASEAGSRPDRRHRRLARKAAREAEQMGLPVIPVDRMVQRLKDPGAGLDGFACRNCGAHVSWHGAGSGHRNHCPSCLFSLHLDVSPGDRAAECEGLMEPIAVWVRRGGEWALVHRCRDCGWLSSNRVAADDNPALLVSLAVRPIGNPPFPLENLAEP